MADTIFTLPGKIGDNICKLPIVARWCKQYGQSADVCLDLSSSCMVSLVRTLPSIDKVFVSDGIIPEKSVPGGQPYDFGKDALFRKFWKNVYHLGYKTYPWCNLTLGSVNDVPIDLTNILTECILPFPVQKPKFLAISAESTRPHSDKEVIDTLLPILSDAKKLFDGVYVITIKKNYQEDPNYTELEDAIFSNDGGDLTITAKLMAQSALVTSHSSMSCLAYILKSPQVSIVNPNVELPHFTSKQSYYGLDTYIEPNQSELLYTKLQELVK